MTDAPQSLARDAGAEAVKLIPPVAVWSLTLNNVLAAVSIAYVLLQIAFLVWKWQRATKAGS
jgi:hypothetical protein